jgi:hypothetical protein
MSTPRTTHALTAELARALGCPPTSYKATLRLESGKAPTLEVAMYATDQQGRFTIDESRDDVTGDVVRRLREIEFKLRLEPFKA